MGYKQKDVALILGHKSSTRLSQWEKGIALPSVINLLKLSFIYRTLPNELYPNLTQKIEDELTANEQIFHDRFDSKQENVNYLF